MDRIIQVQGLTSCLINLVIAVGTLFVSYASAQDDFGSDDAGADLDLESMMGSSGNENMKQGQATPRNFIEKSLLEETSLALQQLGVIVGVAFMVGFLFMVMIGIEILWEKVQEKYQEATGKNQEPEKDPASLVGTFSRYK